MTSTESHAVDEYISSLSDLKTNFKPLINVLTILAEENVEYAPAIVEAIENHLQQVKRESKLPVIYLIDSIVKNVGGEYRNLFARNIVDTFSSVFEKADEDTRVRLQKLRRTWNNVFPPKHLSSLDVQVGLADSSCSSASSCRLEFPSSDTVTASETVSQKQLIVKRELLDLEMQKIELELIQAKMSLEQQRRQLENFMELPSLPANHTETSNDSLAEAASSKAIASVRPMTRDPSKTVSSFRDQSINQSMDDTTSRLQRSDTGLEDVENETIMRSVSSVCNIPTVNFCKQFATTQPGINIAHEFLKNSSQSKIVETKNFGTCDNCDMIIVVDSESLDRDEIKDVRYGSQQKGQRMIDYGTEISENVPSSDGTVDSTQSSLSSPQGHESIDGMVHLETLSLPSPHRQENIGAIVKSENSSISNSQTRETPDGIVDSNKASLSYLHRHEAAKDACSSSNSAKPFGRKLGCKSYSESSQGSPSKIRRTDRYCKSPNRTNSEDMENKRNSWTCRRRNSSTNMNRFESTKPDLRFQRRNETTVNSTQSYADCTFGKEHRSPRQNLVLERCQNGAHNGSLNGFQSKICSKDSRRPDAMRPPDFIRIEQLAKIPIVPSSAVQIEVHEEAKNQPVILPVTFDDPETLKVKQPRIVTALYSGNQCSTCGVRFESKHVTAYRLHLDWHFRQNRKIRESGRKPSSRRLYYNLEDWMEFTLVEDSANRPLSFFETDKPSAEMSQKVTEDLSRASTSVQPSVLCRLSENSRCNVCHDTFEEFYDDGEEEWCLRPTVNHEGINYHPLCLEDYKRSLEESSLDRSKILKNNLHIREDMIDGTEEVSVQFDSEQIKQELSNISSAEKGHEMSALCSIM